MNEIGFQWHYVLRYSKITAKTNQFMEDVDSWYYILPKSIIYEIVIITIINPLRIIK